MRIFNAKRRIPIRGEEEGERRLPPAAERKEEARELKGPTKVVARLFNRKKKH
jgi:hypothetical protein